MQKINYFKRIFKVYLTRDKGYLSFWHEKPAVSEDITPHKLKNSPYYMTFKDKAAYEGPKDESGVILFDYYFDIGRQYNPLAIAQYGLGHWNLYLGTGEKRHFLEAKIHADWLVDNLEKEKNLWVWKHNFKWHYKYPLSPGWYSSHSQGTGISLLGRMYCETGEEKYLEAAGRAFAALNVPMEEGGVKYTDKDGGVWLEEYRVNPPTHILNGYLWALWGVWDFYLLRGSGEAKSLFGECIWTLEKNLKNYDLGFWSRYDLSRQLLPMVASPFYHSLHVVQLKATAKISGSDVFKTYAKKWESYAKNHFFRALAVIIKAVFKIFYF